MNEVQDKKKIRFNFIDVLLIVIAFASITSLVFFLRDRKIVTGGKTDTVEIVYHVKFSALREDFRNLVEIGDTVIDAIRIEKIGEVTNVSYAEGTYTGTDKETGKPVVSSFPGRVSMVLTIRAEAVRTPTGYVVNGRELIIGEDLSLRVPDFTGSGTCLSVEEVTAAENKE